MFANQIMEKTWSHQNPGYSSIFLDNTLENEHGMMKMNMVWWKSPVWEGKKTSSKPSLLMFHVDFQWCIPSIPCKYTHPKNPPQPIDIIDPPTYELCQHNFHPWQIGADNKGKKWGQTKVSQLCICQASFKPESSNICICLMKNRVTSIVYVPIFSMFPHMLSCPIVVGFFFSQTKKHNDQNSVEEPSNF